MSCCIFDESSIALNSVLIMVNNSPKQYEDFPIGESSAVLK